MTSVLSRLCLDISRHHSFHVGRRGSLFELLTQTTPPIHTFAQVLSLILFYLLKTCASRYEPLQANNDHTLIVYTIGPDWAYGTRSDSMMHHSDIKDRRLLMMRIHRMTIMQVLI
jgi:hypothetical protein